MSKAKGMSPAKKELVFGTTHEQNDKLQYQGQQQHFYGREGARGPGGYDPDFRDGSNDQRRQRGNLLSNRNIGLALSKNDRGLLPGSDAEKIKQKTYNMSHAAIGPGSYDLANYNSIGSKYAKKS